MTHSSSPLTSLPLTHFPRWLSSLPVPQLILPSPETSSSNYPHTSLETASEESASNPYGLGQTRAGTMGLASPVRMAHAPKHQDLWGGEGFSVTSPLAQFLPRSETTFTAKFVSCSRRTSKLPVKKNSETGRKGNQRDPKMMKR